MMLGQYSQAIAELPCKKAIRELLPLPYADVAKAEAEFCELPNAIDGQARGNRVRTSIPVRGVASGLLWSLRQQPPRPHGKVLVRWAAGA